MVKRVNQNWLNDRKAEIRKGLPVNVTSSFHKAIQALIILLADTNTPFKLYNLGAGVKRITTEIDICPCCKRKLK